MKKGKKLGSITDFKKSGPEIDVMGYDIKILHKDIWIPFDIKSNSDITKEQNGTFRSLIPILHIPMNIMTKNPGKAYNEIICLCDEFLVSQTEPKKFLDNVHKEFEQDQIEYARKKEEQKIIDQKKYRNTG